MRLRRRHFLQLAAGAMAPPGFFHTAVAQAYPTRPVRLLVPSPPGGLADTLARLMGEWLAGRLRQPFVIENKSGAGNNIAAEAVANAAPDGHTLLITNPAHFLNGALYENSTSISTATLRQSRDFCALPMSWRCTHPYRPNRCLSSSPTPKLIPGRSTTRLPAPAHCSTWPASCSR